MNTTSATGHGVIDNKSTFTDWRGRSRHSPDACWDVRLGPDVTVSPLSVAFTSTNSRVRRSRSVRHGHLTDFPMRELEAAEAAEKLRFFSHVAVPGAMETRRK